MHGIYPETIVHEMKSAGFEPGVHRAKRSLVHGRRLEAEGALTTDRVTIWTVGHSNVAIDALINRLRAHQIALVADVRRFPASRRHPRFGRAALSAALGDAGMGYLHLADLPIRVGGVHAACRSA